MTHSVSVTEALKIKKMLCSSRMTVLPWAAFSLRLLDCFHFFEIIRFVNVLLFSSLFNFIEKGSLVTIKGSDF